MLGIETKRKRTALPVPLAGREIEGHAMGTHGGCQMSRGDVVLGAVMRENTPWRKIP